MDRIVCKKCELENDSKLDYCQLCGANLKGGQDSIPGHVYIVQTPRSPFLEHTLHGKPRASISYS